MKMRKEKLILPIIALFLVMALASATISGNFTAPEQYTNASTTASFNCSTNMANVLNATIFYSASAGAINGTRLTSTANTSASQVSFYFASASVIGVPDGKNINFTCLFVNKTVNELWGIGRLITIDDTNPSVQPSFDRESMSVGGLFKYSTPINDATSGLQSSNCTLTNPEGTASSVSTNLADKLYESSRIIDKGTWTLSCSATDESGNTQTTIDTLDADAAGVNRNISTGTGTTSNKKLIALLLVGGAVALWLFGKKR